ncbi:serine hydrolase domain-containing protein [Microbacterium gorillae]|uniref:serine hydrolase domain-containing protein n=1 Tax=Microbacterium gorillae TaxID=1231063 RepID=UPI000694EE3B|nr:serine hydrolase domain-containing protein [Microbacterium gorillae]
MTDTTTIASTETGAWSYSEPEAQGVSSEQILAFLDAVEEFGSELHSLIILRHGTVIARRWWHPYRPEAPHNLYSLSKTVTSTAIGFAVNEGLLKVDDRVVDLLPDYDHSTAGPYVEDLTVQHLLSMSIGHRGAMWEDRDRGDDWASAFFRIPIEDAPGTVFRYDSASSYLLSVIITKLTGQTVAEFLTPRLFDKLGFEGWIWDRCPAGLSLGSSGLSLRTDDIARLGQFYLDEGVWNGERLLPAEWIQAATSAQVQQRPPWGPLELGAFPEIEKEPDPARQLELLQQVSDYYQGYGYQIWLTRNNGYRAIGYTGQYCLVLPEHDMVIAITSETEDTEDVLSEMIYAHLLPKPGAEALPAAPEAAERLRTRLTEGQLAGPVGAKTTATSEAISGRTFALDPNPFDATGLTLTFGDDGAAFALTVGEVEHVIHCGYEAWIDGGTRMPNTPPGMKPSDGRLPKVAAAGAWTSENTYEMLWRFYEMPHHLRVTCTIDGDAITVENAKSMHAFIPVAELFGEKEPVLTGTL